MTKHLNFQKIHQTLSFTTILTGKGENCPKEERWRSQIDSARVFLQRSSTLLIVSSKTFARHPGTPSARENRDTVFCQMRRALDLIHYIIKEGVVDCTNKFGLDGVSIPVSILSACDEQDSEAFTSTVLRAIKYFQASIFPQNFTMPSPKICQGLLTRD